MSLPLKILVDAVDERLGGNPPMLNGGVSLFIIVRAVLDELAERGFLVVERVGE